MESSTEAERKFYFNFSFFKVDPKWRWMADLAKEESAKEVENVIGNSGIRFRSYSTLGLRDDADFMFWFAAESGEEARQYVIVYPFIKTRDWYLLPVQQRQKLMEEHIEVGKSYPQVVLNTTYSFGIHDEDFMLAFETDDLHSFQNLIMDLRGTQVSKYVAVDTPMIVCVKKDIIPLISSLG